MADVRTDPYPAAYQAPGIEQRTPIGPMLIGTQLNSNLDT